MSDSMRPTGAGNGKPPLSTPVERAALMHRMADRKTEQVRTNKEAMFNRSRTCQGTAMALVEALKPLRSLPVRPCHFTAVSWDCNTTDSYEVTVTARPAEGQHQEEDITLIRFTAHVSADGLTTWICHDDSRVAISIAQDLATTVVEHHFDLAVLEQFEEEIPF